ncbi:MAG: DegQ family serine endoprotease [Bacteroidota bacterium]
MKHPQRFSLVVALVLLVGFAGGIFFMTSLGASKHDSDEPRTSVPAVSPQGKDLLNQFSTAFEAAAAHVNPSVVSISTKSVKHVRDPFADMFGNDMFRRFFGTPRGDMNQTVRSLGSGVIISADGYILTNNHVVDGADELTVKLEDNKSYSAKVVGRDPQTDIAVVKIDAKELPAASLGNSDSVRIGQWVIAVGNPFNLSHTVTAGIISAKGRSSMNLAQYEDYIQTDASINPGNSGGALADLDGNVIGINTAIYSPNGSGNVGIGFAVPINMAKSIMHDLIAHGKVSRGYLGVTIQDVTDKLAKSFDLKNAEGALIGGVQADGPAEKAGLKVGDIVTEFNGKKIENRDQLSNLVAQTLPKSTADLTVLRDGKTMNFKITLAERPDNLAAGNSEENGSDQKSSEKLGLSVQTLNKSLADQMGLKAEHGVVITGVTPGGPAEDAGLQKGDVIQEVNRQKVKSAGDFESQLKKLGKDDTAALLVKRGDNTFFVAIEG